MTYLIIFLILNQLAYMFTVSFVKGGGDNPHQEDALKALSLFKVRFWYSFAGSIILAAMLAGYFLRGED